MFGEINSEKRRRKMKFIEKFDEKENKRDESIDFGILYIKFGIRSAQQSIEGETVPKRSLMVILCNVLP